MCYVDFLEIKNPRNKFREFVANFFYLSITNVPDLSPSIIRERIFLTLYLAITEIDPFLAANLAFFNFEGMPPLLSPAKICKFF